MEWKDEFLSWNASQVEGLGIDRLRIDAKDIWVPDIEVYNLVAQRGLREKEQVCFLRFQVVFPGLNISR